MVMLALSGASVAVRSPQLPPRRLERSTASTHARARASTSTSSPRARNCVLLDTRSCISRLFFDITIFLKLTHASRHVAFALRAEELCCYFAR